MTFPTEDEEQAAFCRWLDKHNIFYFAVPNGGSRNMLEAVKMKKTGTKKGVFDLVVFLENKIAFVEMKRAKKSLSKISESQQNFEKELQKYDYCTSAICYGHQEAIAFIDYSYGLK
jgi:hypothetical protein